jgi:6-phosphofructokinase
MAGMPAMSDEEMLEAVMGNSGGWLEVHVALAGKHNKTMQPAIDVPPGQHWYCPGC